VGRGEAAGIIGSIIILLSHPRHHLAPGQRKLVLRPLINMI
jgi:hypothetical protein